MDSRAGGNDGCALARAALSPALPHGGGGEGVSRLSPSGGGGQAPFGSAPCYGMKGAVELSNSSELGRMRESSSTVHFPLVRQSLWTARTSVGWV